MHDRDVARAVPRDLSSVDLRGVAAPVAELLLGRVAELERTQRAEDVRGFLALFSPSAVWVTGGGRRLVGLLEIAEFTEMSLPGAFADGGTVAYEVALVRQLSAGVAVTGVVQTYTDASGTVTGRGMPTYVWRRDDGASWRIVVGQNTVAT